MAPESWSWPQVHQYILQISVLKLFAVMNYDNKSFSGSIHYQYNWSWYEGYLMKRFQFVDIKWMNV
jgi:hypothetical protein